VLIVGGFLTLPPNYWPLRRRLRRREVERVDICGLWPPDWALAGLLGLGPIMRRTAKAIARSYVAGGRRPIIVVAHSGGGIAARLAMAHQPYHGRRAAVAEAVGCLVTLGTPHRLAELENRYHHAGRDAAAFLDRVTPGAYFAPRTEYLVVGSRNPAATFGGYAGQLAEEIFSMVVGTDTQGLGDGIVPASAFDLEGAEKMIFDDTRHGHIGAPWYGDDHVIDRWWPVALRLWQRALAARAVGASVQPAPSAVPAGSAG
jgi:hypothetical protein